MKKFLVGGLLVVWVIAVVIAAQLIVGYPMTWILGESMNLPVWNAVYSALYYTLAVFLIIFVPWKLFKKWQTSRAELGLSGWPTWADLGLAPVGFIVSLILAAVLMAIFSQFPWFNAEEAQNVGFNYLANDADKIVAFITLVIIAPIAEEIIFRGWLYGKLRKMTNLPVAILVTSLAFALVHFQWNVGVNVFAMSVVLCGLREVTGTIYSGMIMHMIKNGVAFYLLYIAGIS